MKQYRTKGISVVEILIVLAVLAVIFSAVIPQFSNIRERNVLKSAVGDVLSSLHKAQAQTLASLNSSSYGVYFDPDEIIIFKGTVFSALDPGNEAVRLTSPAAITNVTLGGASAASGSLYFRRLLGSPSVAGTVTVSTPHFAKIITISATGSVTAD